MFRNIQLIADSRKKYKKSAVNSTFQMIDINPNKKNQQTINRGRFKANTDIHV